MDKDTVYQVVRRLVGHIDAVGSIQHDERSIINLGTLTDVVDMLLLDISRECSKNMGRHEGSMSEIGMAAKKAIDCFAESIGAADEIDRLRAEVEAQTKRAEALVDLSNGLDKMYRDALAEVEALREYKARLVGLVEQAYAEGFASGYDQCADDKESRNYDRQVRPLNDWEDSRSRQAIDAAREDV